jgi:hypothetical protein
MPQNTKPAAPNGGSPNITVAKYKPHENGCLRGFLDLSIAPASSSPGLRIYDCKLFQKNGERWIKLPDREYKKRDGSKAYAPVVEFESGDLEREFQRAALDALDRFLEEGGDGGPASS